MKYILTNIISLNKQASETYANDQFEECHKARDMGEKKHIHKNTGIKEISDSDKLKFKSDCCLNSIFRPKTKNIYMLVED